jgi:hypothetical protein
MNKLVLTGALIAATAGAAQAPQPPAAEEGNPNERICRIVTQIGSRLNRSRVCMTRAQWRVHRRDMRDTAERIQRTHFHKDND